MYVSENDCETRRKVTDSRWWISKWAVVLLGSALLGLVVTCVAAMSRAQAAYEQADSVECELRQAVNQLNLRLDAIHTDVREIRSDVKAIKANGHPR